MGEFGDGFIAKAFLGARCGGYDLTTTWSLSIGERLQTFD